jgi:two-component system response regulator HydG
MDKKKLLVIDDDEAHRSGMVIMLEDEGYQVEQADSGEAALQILNQNDFDLVITDFKMHELDGMELLKIINDRDPLLKVIMVTGFSSIEQAVQAIHLGAIDYIAKPLEPKKFKSIIQNALNLEESGFKLPADVKADSADKHVFFGEIVGKSKAIKEVITKIRSVAAVDVPVLVTGESGTGKELVALAIHNASPRHKNPFIAVNTGAVSKDLILSELFGHEKGAFTGAVERKTGKFEEANQGTLFLDEISTMSSQVQIALLRVLENGAIDRVGGKSALPVDVRIVAATNEDLAVCIKQGRFREDLFYRLNVFAIELPALRKRKEDIPLLIEFFIKKFNQQYNLNIPGVESDALELLLAYTWPGNIRELRNIILRAMISSRMKIGKRSLPENIIKGDSETDKILISAGTPLPEIERESIIQTLKKVRGNKQKAAKLLKVSRRSLYNKLEQYHIKDEEYGI